MALTEAQRQARLRKLKRRAPILGVARDEDLTDTPTDHAGRAPREVELEAASWRQNATSEAFTTYGNYRGRW
jgi:hypothetical protein